MSEARTAIIAGNVEVVANDLPGEIGEIIKTLGEIIHLYNTTKRKPVTASWQPQIPIRSADLLFSPCSPRARVSVSFGAAGHAVYLIIHSIDSHVYTGVFDLGRGEIMILQGGIGRQTNLATLDRLAVTQRGCDFRQSIVAITQQHGVDYRKPIQETRVTVTSHVSRSAVPTEVVAQFITLTDWTTAVVFDAKAMPVLEAGMQQGMYLKRGGDQDLHPVFPIEGIAYVTGGFRIVEGNRLPYVTVSWNDGENTIITYFECNQDEVVNFTQWQMFADKKSIVIGQELDPDVFQVMGISLQDVVENLQ